MRLGPGHMLRVEQLGFTAGGEWGVRGKGNSGIFKLSPWKGGWRWGIRFRGMG